RLGRSVLAAERRRHLKKIPARSGKRHLWTLEGDALLGRQPDHKIAERLGVATNTVQSRRQELGIAPASAPKLWRKEEDAALGKIPDRALSDMIGRTKAAVTARRHAKGIAPFQRIPRIGHERNR